MKRFGKSERSERQTHEHPHPPQQLLAAIQEHGEGAVQEIRESGIFDSDHCYQFEGYLLYCSTLANSVCLFAESAPNPNQDATYEH